MFTPLSSEVNSLILCYYFNSSNQIQIIRISNVPNWYFEKVVFPKQRLMFEAIPDATLEINTKIIADFILSDKIQCNLLSVEEEVNQLPLKADVA